MEWGKEDEANVLLDCGSACATMSIARSTQSIAVPFPSFKLPRHMRRQLIPGI
jgi:hypothetical protein